MTASLTISPTTQQVYAALVPFVMGVTGLPTAQVLRGLQNRASMPMPGFVLLQAIGRRRLRTNIDSAPTSDEPTTQTMEEGVELTVQIDCYGPTSLDWANMLSATLRDEYGVRQLAPAGVVPLYADEARVAPLVDEELQYEERWSVDAHFQVNPVTTVTQQYADALELELINVQAEFPT